MWQIEYFEKANGRIPVKEFLDSLSNKDDLSYITNAIYQLMQHGYQLKRPQVGYLKDDIFELRIKTSNRHFRFLYFFHNNRIIVLTHGFIKKTKRVPEEQIKKALQYKAEYQNRMGNSK